MLPQAHAADARAIARRLDEEVKEIKIPVQFSSEPEVRVTISQGIATFPGDSASADDLLKKADEALYLVKSRGGGGFALYGEIEENNAQNS
jgi:diguanylate cyclase (GGDEF)-like protein